MVAAYQSCATFADAQVGRVLDALDKSPHGENTVVVLWSDHGYHLGEKQHIEKFALWEKTTHVPLIIVAPGKIKAGIIIERPVDLTAIYPTLVELCGLPAKKDLDGLSLAPLFANPEAVRPPALMTQLKGNHALRTEGWRYIHYADGGEELYDHTRDKNEWVNLAADPKYKNVLEELRTHLPKTNADSAPDMKRPAANKAAGGSPKK
jgi:arylsulfatase A-like enzyme